jgi:hypothetical protein
MPRQQDEGTSKSTSTCVIPAEEAKKPLPSARTPPTASTKGASHLAIKPEDIKEVSVDRTQSSLKALASHGIELEGVTCVLSNDGRKYWVCPEEGCERAYTRPSKLKIHLLVHKEVKINLSFAAEFDSEPLTFTLTLLIGRFVRFPALTMIAIGPSLRRPS